MGPKALGVFLCVFFLKSFVVGFSCLITILFFCFWFVVICWLALTKLSERHPWGDAGELKYMIIETVYVKTCKGYKLKMFLAQSRIIHYQEHPKP